MNDYDFEWDPAKAIINVGKHGISFEEAATVFLDSLALTVYDRAHSENEERWFTLGYAANGKLLAIAHTYQAIDLARVRIRLISARPATMRERKNYESEAR